MLLWHFRSAFTKVGLCEGMHEETCWLAGWHEKFQGRGSLQAIFGYRLLSASTTYNHFVKRHFNDPSLSTFQEG